MSIPREDVATVCVEALKYPEARFRTFEIYRKDGPPVTDWKAKFASLKAPVTAPGPFSNRNFLVRLEVSRSIPAPASASRPRRS